MKNVLASSFKYGNQAIAMMNVIALTQFVFLSLGIMAVKILVKASGGQASPLPAFLSQYGVWFFLIPTVWIIFATVSTMRKDNGPAFTTAKMSGILITAAIFVVFGAAILLPL